MIKSKTKWEGGRGTYGEGECDIPDCHNKPVWRNWDKDPCGFQGSDDLLASLCDEHKEYKSFNTTKKIIEKYYEKNKKHQNKTTKNNSRNTHTYYLGKTRNRFV